MALASPTPPRARHTACLVGLGNIGSQLVPLIARTGAFGGLTLVDPDTFDAGNWRGQNMQRTDAGVPKSEAMAKTARRIDPALEITAIRAPVEDVPLARLRADVLVSGPDTRRARQHVNRIAWRLGVRAWIDLGIEPSAQLVRVSLFVPRADEACLECAWGPDEYATAGEHASCAGRALASAPSTNAPAALGAIAAAHAALLADEVLGTAGSLTGFHLTLAVRAHRLAVTHTPRHASCRFDHATLPLDVLVRVPASATLPDLALAAGVDAHGPGLHLVVDGCDFATRLVCASCGTVREGAHVLRPASGAGSTCRCGGPYATPALHVTSQLALARLSPSDRTAPLARLGLLPGDIVGVASGVRTRLVELVGPPGAQPPVMTRRWRLPR